MKENLNLLPSEAGKIVSKKRGVIFYVTLILSIYLIIIITLSVFNIIEQKKIKEEMVSLLHKKAEMQSAISRLAMQTVPATEPVEKELVEAVGNAKKWSRVISSISLVVPQDVCLTSIDAKQESGTIVFKGSTITQIGVASFIAALQKSETFDNVEIVYSQKGAKEVAFEIKARLRWTY